MSNRGSADARLDFPQGKCEEKPWGKRKDERRREGFYFSLKLYQKIQLLSIGKTANKNGKKLAYIPQETKDIPLFCENC